MHHIKPKCTFKDKNDPAINHPRNLIALHPDDHVTIHKCRGDKFVNGATLTIIAGWAISQETRDKISKTQKGRIGNRLGSKHSLESKKQMSKSMKGRTPWNKGKPNSQIPWNKGLKGKQSAHNKGKTGTHFYNNGKVNKLFKPGEEPESFILGKLLSQRNNFNQNGCK